MPIPYIRLHNQKIKILYFKKYHSILDALEKNDITTNSQCREGYCGVCRTPLTYGNIKYLKQPLAYIKNSEILICCCSPINNIQLKLKS